MKLRRQKGSFFFKRKYELACGGWVKFKWSEVESVRPSCNQTTITLSNGHEYCFKGRNYGV